MKHIIKRIDELCDRITDGAHNSPEECINGPYPMYSSKDMLYGGFDDSDVKMISAQDYEKLVAQDCQPQIDDILIIKDGANYLKFAFRITHKVEAVILSSIAILRPNKSIINPDYFTQLSHKQMTAGLNHCGENQEEKRSIDIKRGYNLENPTCRRVDEKAPE